MIGTIGLKKYLLDKTDWTQVADNNLTAEEKETWAVYRQALRDLDSSKGILDLTWPVPPAEIRPYGGFPFKLDTLEQARTNIQTY
jgi:hypothetical protein